MFPYPSCWFGKPGVVLIKVSHVTYCVDGIALDNPSLLSTCQQPGGLMADLVELVPTLKLALCRV
jgi:hypothetical protein